MEKDEKTQVGIQYLSLLFENDKALLINYSSYCTTISTLKKKTGYSKDIDSIPESVVLDDSERENLTNLINNIKFYVISIQKILIAIKPYLDKNIKSLSSAESSEKFKGFKEKYVLIRDSLTPAVEDIDSYLDYVNEYIVLSTIEDLFMNKVDELRSAYAADRPK